MTESVEPTGSGFVVRDAAGKTKASLVLSTGPEAGKGELLILVGDLSLTIPLDVDGFRHGERVFGRAHTAALFARGAAGGEPLVSRREPELPKTTSPWV